MGKKLLVVSQHFWPEPIFRFHEYCIEFVKKGYDVEVICGLPNYPTGQFAQGYGYFGKRKETYNGIKIKRCFEIKRGNSSYFRLVLNFISYSLSGLVKIPYLLTQKYDHILMFQLTPISMIWPGLIVSKLKKIPSTIYVFDVWPENIFSVVNFKSKKLRNFITRLSNWHYKKADKLVVYSESARELFIKRLGISPDKIICVPQSCEKLHEEDITDPILIERFSNSFNIVFTGTVNPGQSFETIVTAAKRIIDDGIEDIKWIIVGDGMSLNWLKNEIKKNNLSKYFVFEGIQPVSRVPSYTYIADGLISCLNKADSYNYAIPAKVMSYFAAGKPMLLAIDGEIQDIVNENQFGFACDAEDSEQLYLNIKKLYSMPKVERAEMGARVKEYHYANYEWTKCFEKLEAFIREEDG